MNSMKTTSYILVLGTIILGIFTYIISLNIFNSKASTTPLFSRTEEIEASIKKIEIINDRLVITTNNDAKEACIKTTKTKPKLNSLCWIKIENNQAIISTYIAKTYYIWLKDSNNNISDYIEYAT